jgi:hypothetical protein
MPIVKKGMLHTRGQTKAGVVIGAFNCLLTNK